MIIKICHTPKGIKLIDNDGMELMRKLPDEVKNRIKKQKTNQFRHSCEEIKDQIIAHDVISFDIFDTLITRRVTEPELVFDMVGRYAIQNGIHIQHFRQERIKAQLESGLSNANLDEIYEQLVINTSITKEQAEQLKKEELKCERKIILPRRDVVELFHFALEAQKKVFLTTDMYLNRRHIVSLLNTCRITGYYDILDSCEYRKLKLEGLFEELKVINSGKSILHIGDSYINDCICAEVAGVDSLLISKSVEIASKKNKSLCHGCGCIADNIVIGTLISSIYNSPFRTAKESKDQNWFNIGYLYMGPIVLSFIGWMINEIKLDDYDGILLSSRDGYLLDKVFSILRERELICKKIETRYFRISRKAAVAMHTDEEAVINMLVDRTESLYSPDRLLREVFCMEVNQINPYDPNKYTDDKYKYIWEQHAKIRKNVYKLKRNFYRYLGEQELKIGGRYLLYDFVSSGTVQRALSSLVPFELDGCYFQFAGKKDFVGELYSRFPKECLIIKNHYKILENLMLSPNASVWGYGEDGGVLYCTEERSKRLIKSVERVHQGVISFTNQFLDSFEIKDSIISEELTLSLIQKLCEYVDKIGYKDDVIDDWLMGGGMEMHPSTPNNY